MNDYLFCRKVWSGLLIQATVGMLGGRGLECRDVSGQAGYAASGI